MKIFGIGLSRTGTTSLTQVLKNINFNIIHYPTRNELFNGKNDGACDIPVAIHFKELDKKFSNSKFIYTIREKNNWLIAIEKYLKNKQNRKLAEWKKQNRIDIYSTIEFNKNVFSKKYDEHDKNIKEYFKNRKQDLLILNICGGDDLKKLLTFIGISKCNFKEFPNLNKLK